MENSNAGDDDASVHLVFTDNKKYKHCYFAHCKKSGTLEKSLDDRCRFHFFYAWNSQQKGEVSKIERSRGG